MPEFDGPIKPTGDGGSGQVPQVGGMLGGLNPFDSKQMSNAETQSGELLESAKGGGFRVSENAAQPIREALADAQEEISGILNQSWALAQAPMLGSGPYAKQVAEHVRQSGDGPQGILPVLQQLQSIIQNSEQALKIAMDNYRESEAQQQSTFNGNA